MLIVNRKGLFERERHKMENNKEKKNQEEHLDEQYEFGLNEETRKELAKEDDDHKESENLADEDDHIIKDD